MQNDSAEGLSLPSRLLPWPTSTSPQARENLVRFAEQVGPDVVPECDDIEAWSQHIIEANQALLQSDWYFGVPDRAGTTSRPSRLGDVNIFDAAPLDVRRPNCIYLEIHGGGLVYLAGEGCRRGGLMEAERLGVRVISVDYRVPPAHPYPCALDDCLNVYRALLQATPPDHIIIGGTSGGGNLAPAMLLKARDEGLPMPAALVLITPEVDLTESGDSFQVFQGLDPVIQTSLAKSIALYAQGKDLADPYLSPLFGDLTGFPPTLLQSGTRDMLLSNTVRMHRALRKHGVAAELQIWQVIFYPHFPPPPEDDEVSAEIRAFVDRHWPASHD